MVLKNNTYLLSVAGQNNRDPTLDTDDKYMQLHLLSTKYQRGGNEEVTRFVCIKNFCKMES